MVLESRPASRTAADHRLTLLAPAAQLAGSGISLLYLRQLITDPFLARLSSIHHPEMTAPGPTDLYLAS